ncbi:hypothetical protein NDU88_003631 [Pleurodeles waltl]|uniref:Uncharacterized protein n=1 Tax=Pleurodeles waltl TaxID=8319 RepID=A0AAV7UEW8_PLEWA|nr:hypothetical protein NDU88_003631 [Pleurodeles waltl]
MAFTSPEAVWSPSSTRSAVSSCPTALPEVARASGSSGRCALQIVCFDLGPAGTPSSPRGAPHRAVLRTLAPPATAAAVPPRPRRRHDSGPTQQALHLPAALRCLRRFVTGAPLQFFLLAPAEAAVQTNFV